MTGRASAARLLRLADRLPDYDRDGSLSSQAGMATAALRGTGETIAGAFWQHYGASRLIEGLWTDDQISRLKGKTAQYFNAKFDDSLSQEWVDLAQSLAASAYRASIPITTVLASLSEAHRASQKAILSRYKAGSAELFAALEGLSRINLLEAEVITTAIAHLEAQDLADRRTNDAEAFRRGISDSVSRVAEQSRELGNQSQDVLSSAQAMEIKMSEVACAADEAAAAMANAAMSSSDIASSIADLKTEAAGLDRAVDGALDQMLEAERQCEELETQAATMEAVVEIVRSVAQRTKLLALNATIEAARAGDAGRGFSVVAQEVKSLSIQTEEAIDSISAHVTVMQSATSRTTEAHSIIKSAVGDIKTSSARVEEIAATQLARSALIASAVDQSAGVVRETSAAVAVIRDVSPVSTNGTDLRL